MQIQTWRRGAAIVLAASLSLAGVACGDDEPSREDITGPQGDTTEAPPGEDFTETPPGEGEEE